MNFKDQRTYYRKREKDRVIQTVVLATKVGLRVTETERVQTSTSSTGSNSFS